MGVDISTYRCRVGQFAPHHGAGGMCLALDYSLLVKIIGAVVFIRILLVMAGIEQNPGPQEKFVFRYQYLLIDIGARILREIFEAKVGRDFVTYLATNNAASKTLRSLMTGKNRKITTDQEKLLPPIEMHPTSSSFDITLLSLLLRNVCGLSPAGDNVWINPPATDHTLEADITRLRKCRNEVMHTDTVRISAKELNDKWLYLDEILNRLNTTAGIANLSKLINDATHMDIDEELKERYIETIKAWVTLDCSLDEAKEDISLLKRNQSELDTRVGAVEEQHAKRQRAYDFKDIQKDLIELYKRQCNTLPVSPLFDDKDENILKIYKRPTMCSVDNRKKKNKELTSFEEMFCKDDKSCNQIYITGDAGMGKTSLCIFMCSLWSKGKLREKLDDKHKKDVEYMSKFDIVFYLNLRDTEKHGVIDIIKEQYLSHHDPLMIQDLLRKQRCLILMDGLDEWQPKQDGKKKYKLPERLYSDNCVYITTSRPYRIESERLPRRDVDHHIQITGIHGNASKSYVRDVIQYINEENSTISGVDQFVEDIDECGLGDQYDIQYTKREVSAFYRVINECDVHDQLCIPMVASQLVVLWFDGKLTNTPMALIYANILEMLFRRAEKKDVKFPPPTASTWTLPASLHEFKYLNEYVSLLYNVCHLSFRALFKQDKNVTSLVFTRQQLVSTPYCFSIEETDFLCKIGILSKNEIVGCYSEEKLKISFIHKSYVEYFASLFTVSFDRDNVYTDVTQSWKTLNDVVQFENFFLLLAGLSYNKVKSSIENFNLNVSNDLTTHRRNSVFYCEDRVKYSIFGDHNVLSKIQNIVINCYKEVSRSNVTNIELKLEDFIFDERANKVLKQILMLNKACVYSVRTTAGTYFEELNQIENLQCLHVGTLKFGYLDSCLYDERFTEIMVQNRSTLHTVCIECVGFFFDFLNEDTLPTLYSLSCGGFTSVPELPLRTLHHLTSLSLSSVSMQHTVFHNLVTFLSDNVLIEHIKLNDVACDTHRHGECTMTLNLPKLTNLKSLYLTNVTILCHNVNTSRLKYIVLRPPIMCINISYIDVYNCIKDSQLEHLDFHGMLDDNTTRMLTASVKTLSCIKSLKLSFIEFLHDDVLLQLHPDVRQVKIKLHHVTMSRQCFQCVVESIQVNRATVNKVKLKDCTIISVDGETHRKLSCGESVEYMSEYIVSIQTVNVTGKGDTWLNFETSCQ